MSSSVGGLAAAGLGGAGFCDMVGVLLGLGGLLELMERENRIEDEMSFDFGMGFEGVGRR